MNPKIYATPKEQRRANYLRNREQIIAKVRAYQKAHPRPYSLAQWRAVDRCQLRRFNLTPEQYQVLLAKQDGVCAICHQTETRITALGVRQRLAVDHDHGCCPGQTSCGKCIRGLLCRTCNMRLQVLENTEFLESARTYLQRNY